jgi:hypothetical protein
MDLKIMLSYMALPRKPPNILKRKNKKTEQKSPEKNEKRKHFEKGLEREVARFLHKKYNLNGAR